MTNFNYIDKNTIQFVIPPDENGFQDVITFKRDLTLPVGTVRISCQDSTIGQPSKILYYNIDQHQKIVSVDSAFTTIYDQYIKPGKFIPTGQEYGHWCTYKPENKSYYLRFGYIFNVTEDYSSVPACAYYTSPISEFISDTYQYANRSSCNSCSHPTIIENNPSEVFSCAYKLSGKSFHICPLYKEDSKVHSVYSLTSKYNESEAFKISSKIYRDNDGIKRVASIYQTLADETEIEIHQISIDTLSGLSDSDYFSTISNLMNEVLEAYTETHVIEIIQNSEQISPVEITKKSYIASLV